MRSIWMWTTIFAAVTSACTGTEGGAGTPPSDASTDSATPFDAARFDASSDAIAETRGDAKADAPMESSSDAPLDGPLDAPPDAPRETGDASDAGADATGGPLEGDVHLVKRMGDKSFDALVTSPSSTTIKWIDDHFYRMQVFSTFFDDKTAWYPNGLLYSDSYAIYLGSDVATAHPEWILRDDSGGYAYIQWGCSGGTCPQYAADITNADFRNWWIDALKTTLARGYKGAWIDDVNLDLRVSDGSGTSVVPTSPTTKELLTQDVWSAAFADFTDQIRAEIPAGYEILHNSIWYATSARTDDANVKREIAAADWINMEHGFAEDAGLTGGTGVWSIDAKMKFVDAVHGMGRHVIIDDIPSDDVQREYALGVYLLVTDGVDGLGDLTMDPTTWWSGYDVHLGHAAAARTRDAKGLFRRDFDGGVALVLEPDASPQTVTFPAGKYVRIDGSAADSVTLTAKTGAVLIAK